MGSLEETLLAEAQRQLDQQFSDLETLRTRSVNVLAVDGVVAGLFVGRLDQHLGGFGGTALALLLVADHDRLDLACRALS